jgi:hypothetical protein
MLHRPLFGRRTQLAASALIGGGVVALAATGASAHDDYEESANGFRVESVKVITANTVETRFSHPLDTSKITLSVFHAPHYDWDVPHSHNATSITYSNGDKTARVVLDRNLHPQMPLCNTSEPRCSDDELDWVITGATDIYGNKISDDDWEVWAIGSDD